MTSYPFDILFRQREGSHSGLGRAPAKRLGGESSLMGSNPIPSAKLKFSENIKNGNI